MTGGGSADTLDPQQWFSTLDALRIYQLFNSLVAFDKNAQPQLSLAEEFSPNSTATEWTVRLRSGVEWHDGKPLTADDVIFSYQRIANPKNPLLGAASLATVDVKNIRKIDNRTLKIPCHVPSAGLYEAQACYDFFIVPTGFDPKHPIGTGPFKFKSFTPGQQSTFVRNANYWEHGLPYVDQLTIADFADETSVVNALLSGQLDLVGALSGPSLPTVQSGGGKILINSGGFYTPFTMRVDRPPFNDVRVRQALRLVIDRPQMNDLLFSGHGRIGNDLFGLWDPDYDHSLPQRQADIEQAKSLLKQAGHDGLTLTLTTAEVSASAVNASQVFAQQAKAAGVTINLNKVEVDKLFGPNYLQWDFAQDVWSYCPYLFNVQLAMLPKAVFNECHLDDPTYTRLANELAGTLDAGRRRELVHDMQTREYEGTSSGYIIPVFTPDVDGYTTKVNGLQTSKLGNPFGGYDLQHVWLT